MIELAVNELSYNNANVSKQEDAELWYDTFFGICKKIAKDHNTSVVLRYSAGSNINDTAFYPTYSFGQWLNSKGKDDISLILQMLTQMPLINYPSYKVYNTEGHGIGYSYENDSLLISINSHPCWQQNKLTVIKEYLNDDASQLQTETKDINNCFEENCINIHQDFIKSKLPDKPDPLLEITSGEILWRERERFFPSLVFCDQVENQIRYLSGPAIINLRKYLKEFEDYFSKWKEGDFDRNALSGRPRLESVTRLRDYRNELSIACPDGKERTFSLHSNWWGGDSRMHFYPDAENPDSRKCIIGYIGDKIV